MGNELDGRPEPTDITILGRCVRILKMASLHRDFLDEFHNDLVTGIVTKYRKYGLSLYISKKQIKQLELIAEKLFFDDKGGSHD